MKLAHKTSTTPPRSLSISVCAVVMCCWIGLNGSPAQAQTPTSGALLTISGTVTSGATNMPVNTTIGDRDIHSGVFSTVPVAAAGNASNCMSADQLSTDAYVLQAGAPTGCDPGDLYEGNQISANDGHATLNSLAGSAVAYSFAITTHYQCGPNEGACNATTMTSTNGLVSGDTGFLTVTNNGTSTFTGTITLAGKPNVATCGSQDTVTPGSDEVHPALGPGASVILALANDSSGCGGYNSSQTQTLEPGVQTVYTHGNDNWKITPQFSTGGEQLRMTLVPILKSNYQAPQNFSGESCVPFADLSAIAGHDTCGLWQADCSVGGVANGGDCTTLLYQVMESYDLPPDLPAIGGPDFLVVHFKGCPTNSTDTAESIFTSYTVNRIDPTTSGSGGGTGSCFEVTYNTNAPAITSGTFSRFTGFDSPVIDSALNMVKAGSTLPLKFTFFDVFGNPITNLSYCYAPSTTQPGVCTDSPAVASPWVNIFSFGIPCPGGQVNTQTDTSSLTATNNSLQNLGGGAYQFNWKTQKAWAGYCTEVEVKFDGGLKVVPATLGFQFN